MRMKELRERAGLSQYELAPKLGLKQSTYANYEIEKTQPTIEMLMKIADFYGVSLDYLCEHKTQNILQLSLLNDTQREIVNKVVEMNERQQDRTLGYIENLFENK